MRTSGHARWRLLVLPLAAAGCLAAGVAEGQQPPPPPPSGILPVAAPAGFGSQPTHVSIRAWVNNNPLFDQELLGDAGPELLQNSRAPEPQRSAQKLEILKTHLQKLIDDELIWQDAERKLKGNAQARDKLKEMAEKEFEKSLPKQKRRVGGEERFQVWLTVQGLTLETYRRKWERQFFINQYLYSRIGPIQDAIGQPDIREYYDQHANEFQTVDRVEWQDLFIAVGPKHATLRDAHLFAEQLVTRLRGGEDFASLLPYDDGLGSANKGTGIGQRHGEIRPPEAEAYLWNMRDGDVGPALDLSTGVHVFRLVKRHYAGQLPYDEKVQAQIRDKLRQEVWGREVRRIVRELTDRAVIQVARHPLP